MHSGETRRRIMTTTAALKIGSQDGEEAIRAPARRIIADASMRPSQLRAVAA